MTSSQPRSRRRREVLEKLLIVGGFVVVFLLEPHGLDGDDPMRFSDIEGLLHHGTVSKSPFSLAMPLVSSPFLLLGEVFQSPQWWASRFNVIVLGVGALVCFRLLRGRADPELLRRTLLVLLFGSMLTERLRDYNAEVLTATLFAVGIVCLVTRRAVVPGWWAMVLGVVNTPAALAPLLLVVGNETLREKRLRNLWPVAAAVLLIMTEDWVRRGGPLTTGYENDHGIPTILPYSGRPEFSYPFVLGVVSILFSFGRGLLFFTPGLALWLDGRTRRLAASYRHALVLMLLIVCGLVLVYAKWWAWYGGLTWGPRFFTFAALPSSFLIAVRLGAAGASAAADAVTLLALALSAWVAISGVIADLSMLQICVQGGYQLESLCWYVPDFSPLWWPWLQSPPLTVQSEVAAAFCLGVFLYLALPLLASIGAALRKGVLLEKRYAGWRL